MMQTVSIFRDFRRMWRGDVPVGSPWQPETEESHFTWSEVPRSAGGSNITRQAGPGGVSRGSSRVYENRRENDDPDALAGSGEIFYTMDNFGNSICSSRLDSSFKSKNSPSVHLDQAEAKYHLTPGAVAIDELVLRSANIHLRRRDSELSWEASFEFRDWRSMKKFARNSTSQSAPISSQPRRPGYSAVDSKSVEHSNDQRQFLEKVVGRDLKDLVNSFFGRKSDSRKRKKARDKC